MEAEQSAMGTAQTTPNSGGTETTGQSRIVFEEGRHRLGALIACDKCGIRDLPGADVALNGAGIRLCRGCRWR